MRPIEQQLQDVAGRINGLQEHGAQVTGHDAQALGAALTALRDAIGAEALDQALCGLGASARQANRLMLVAAAMGSDAGQVVLGETCGLAKLAALANLDETEMQALAAGECLRGLSLAELRAMSARQLGNALATVTADERALLVRYRRCTEPARRHVQQAAHLLADKP